MPGSSSDIVTVGNRAALLQYQTSAEDGVCPPGSLQLRASPTLVDGGEEEEERQTTCR